MRIFDRIDPSNLDRRELQLWVLAIFTLVVFAAGMALLMYPVVSLEDWALPGSVLRRIFSGFCVLSILLVGYIVERQFVIRKLRKQLAEAQRCNLALRHQASADLLGTLPEFNHLQDRLPMEFRRSVNTRRPLSLLLICLKPARGLTDQEEISTAFGDAAKAIIRRLRREDSIYLLAPGAFGILLPGVSGEGAYQVAARLTDSLHDASGASERFWFHARVINYPEHTETAREMEEAVRSVVSFGPAPEGAEEPTASANAP